MPLRTISLVFLLIPVAFVAQDLPEKKENYQHFGVHLNAGSIYAHSADVENTTGSVPFGFELEYSFRNLSSDAWNTCHCYPTTGFIVGYTNYDNWVLGQGVHASYFLEHVFLPFKKWSPVIRGAAGFAYSTNPYHAHKNPDNQSYSLPVNAFLQLQLGVNVFIGESAVVSVRGAYHHISNGGVKEPNKGINWPNVSVAYLHLLNYASPQPRPKRALSAAEQKWLKRVVFFGAYTTREFDKKESFLAYGAMATVSRKVGVVHGISGGAEWHYHQEHERRIEWNGQDASAHRAALLIGHDFLFGKVIFSQQIGVYVLDNYRYHDPLYHRWTISYVFANRVSIGTSLKAHRHVAEFLDVRLGFHW